MSKRPLAVGAVLAVLFVTACTTSPGLRGAESNPATDRASAGNDPDTAGTSPGSAASAGGAAHSDSAPAGVAPQDREPDAAPPEVAGFDAPAPPESGDPERPTLIAPEPGQARVDPTLQARPAGPPAVGLIVPTTPAVVAVVDEQYVPGTPPNGRSVSQRSAPEMPPRDRSAPELPDDSRSVLDGGVERREHAIPAAGERLGRVEPAAPTGERLGRVEPAAPDRGRPDQIDQTTPTGERRDQPDPATPDRGRPDQINPAAPVEEDNARTVSPTSAGDTLDVAVRRSYSPDDGDPPTVSSDPGESAVDPPAALEGVPDTAAAPPREREQTASTAQAEQNRVFSVVLDRAGWVYLGAEGPGTVDYIRRDFVDGGVAFFFQADAPGSYALRFDGQRLETGTTWTHVVTVDVAPPVEHRIARPSSDADGEGTVHQITTVPGTAPGSGTDSSSAPIAQSEESTRVDRVEVGRDGTGSTRGSANATTTALSDPMDEPLIERARALQAENDVEGELALLTELLETGSTDFDWVLFRLASIYEMPAYRDYRRARALYERVVHEYPFSEWWEPARRRVAYLQRHFFDIR